LYMHHDAPTCLADQKGPDEQVLRSATGNEQCLTRNFAWHMPATQTPDRTQRRPRPTTNLAEITFFKEVRVFFLKKLKGKKVPRLSAVHKYSLCDFLDFLAQRFAYESLNRETRCKESEMTNVGLIGIIVR